MFKFYVTKEEFEKLKNDDNFLTAIKLLRVDSAIITSLSQIEKVIDQEKETSRDRRDRIEGILYHGAVLYESIETFKIMQQELKSLNEFRKHLKDIKDLLSEKGGHYNFINKTLHTVRTKLVFHFDEDIFKEILPALEISDKELLILEGDHEASGYINYPIVMELYFNYLVKELDYSGSVEEKLKYMLSEMNLISIKLCDIIESLAGELLEDIVHIEENS